MLTLDQLITPQTEDSVMATILTLLTQFGFQATSWQDGSIQLTILRLFAKLFVQLTSVVNSIARGGFTSLASKSYLQLLAQYVYKVTPIAAQPTIGTITLTSAVGAPSHSWIAGDIIVADQPQGSANANSYTITQAGTLAPGTSATFQFKSDVPGAAANIAPNVTLYFWTPLVGVTPTNPPIPPSNTWVTTPGQDDESAERLAARCLARWSELGYANTDGAYIGWALEALPAITRRQVANAQGTGLVTLYLATAAGPITGPQATTIANYINGVTDGIGRRPINDVLVVTGTSVLATPAIAITAYVESSVFGTIAADIVADVLTYLGAQPVGGVKLVNNAGQILLDGIVSAAKFVIDENTGEYTPRPGLRSLTIPLSGNIAISDGQIYAPSVTVTPILVAPGV